MRGVHENVGYVCVKSVYNIGCMGAVYVGEEGRVRGSGRRSRRQNAAEPVNRCAACVISESAVGCPQLLGAAREFNTDTTLTLDQAIHGKQLFEHFLKEYLNL